MPGKITGISLMGYPFQSRKQISVNRHQKTNFENVTLPALAFILME